MAWYVLSARVGNNFANRSRSTQRLRLSDSCFGALNKLRVLVGDGSCEDPINVLIEIVGYLQRNPSDILILILDGSSIQGSRRDLLSELLNLVPGLASVLYRHPGDAYPWPRLQQLVEQDTRLVAFVESPKEVGLDFYHDWSSYGTSGKLDLTDSIAASTAYCGYITADLDFLSLEIVASCQTPDVLLDLQLTTCEEIAIPNFLVADTNTCAGEMVLMATSSYNAELVPVPLSTANVLLELQGLSSDTVDTTVFVEQCQKFFMSHSLENVECTVLSQSKSNGADGLQMLLQVSADILSHVALSPARLQEIIEASGSTWEESLKETLGLTGIEIVAPEDGVSVPTVAPVENENPAPLGFGQAPVASSPPTPGATTTSPVQASATLGPSRNVTAVREKIVNTVEERRFQNAGNFVNLALDWIIQDDVMALHHDADNLVQRFTMAYFYFATSKRGWTSCGRKDGVANCTYYGSTEPQPATRWLSSASECEWIGVACDEEDRVIEISLGTRQLFVFVFDLF